MSLFKNACKVLLETSVWAKLFIANPLKSALVEIRACAVFANPQC